MNASVIKEFFEKHPCCDLSGKWVAYDIDGRVLGEVVYKKGVVISRKTYGKRTYTKRAKRSRAYGNRNN